MRERNTAEANCSPACHFTLFIVLPWEQVCSLRQLPSGITVRSLFVPLELISGCPAKTYSLVTSHGQSLDDDQKLIYNKNVWDGYVVRLKPLDAWAAVYDGVVKSNLEWMVSLTETDQKTSTEVAEEGDFESKQIVSPLAEYGGVALFLSCWLGLGDLVSKILGAGVDPNWQTPHGRTAMFACVAKDNERILYTLLSYEANSYLSDNRGETALIMAKRTSARQCIKAIHSFHIHQIPEADLSASNVWEEVDISQSITPYSSQLTPISRDVNNINDGVQNGKSNELTAKVNKDFKSVDQRDREPVPKNLIDINNRNTQYCNGVKVDAPSHEENNKTRRMTPHSAMVQDGAHDLSKMVSNKDKIQGRCRTKQHKGPNTSHYNKTTSSSHHDLSQTMSTPRNLKYFSEDGFPHESSPRSNSGLAKLRISQWQGPGRRASSQQRLYSAAFDDQPPRSQTSLAWNEKGKTVTINVPYQNLSVDVRDTSPDAMKSCHFIGQNTSPRHTSPSLNLRGKIQTSAYDTVSSEYAQVNSQEKKNDYNKEDNVDKRDEDIEKPIDNASDANKEECENNQDLDKTSRKANSAGTVRFKSAQHVKLRRQMSAKRRENEATKTAKRRIQLLEQQKRHFHRKQTFDQWLAAKRRQRFEQEQCSESDQSEGEDSSSGYEERARDSRTMKQIMENNSEAFVNWVREIESRNVNFNHPNSAKSLHKRKSRPLKGLISISGKSRDDCVSDENKIIDTSKYLHSYQDWKKKRLEEEKKERISSSKNKSRVRYTDDKENTESMKRMTSTDAKNCLDAMRNEVLAEAVTFDDWMNYQEQRKKLTDILSHAKNKGDEIQRGETNVRSKSAGCKGNKNNGKFISFEKWKQNLETQEAKRKIAQLRMRREQEEEKRSRDKERRASSAKSHEAWSQQKIHEKREEKQKMQTQTKQEDESRIMKIHGSREEGHGFDAWLNKKHEKEIQRVEENIRKEQQLLKEARFRKGCTEYE